MADKFFSAFFGSGSDETSSSANNGASSSSGGVGNFLGGGSFGIMSDASGFRKIISDDPEVETIPWYQIPQNTDKGQLLQETRAFSNSPLNVRQCRQLITKLLYLLNNDASSGAALTRTEATDLFFATTKLFQSKDILLRRTMILLLKELVERADDVIIVISSLTKDITSPNESYKSTALRVLARVIDGQMLSQIDRIVKASIVDRAPSVASAALVSGVHLMGRCPEVVRRWASEAQDATQARSSVVQYHALGLLQAIRRNDRLAVAKLVSAASYNGIKSPLAQCALVRFAKQIAATEPGGAGSEGVRPMVQYIESCLRSPSDMVVLEAARALCELPGLPPKQLAPVVNELQMFLNSSKSTTRYAALRTLNKLAGRYSTLVAQCNPDLETLVNDGNRSVATLAIACLLKTGTEASVDKLVKIIAGFVSDVPDDFRIQLVDALRTLALKYETKAKAIVPLFASMLREEGGFEFKSAVVRAIVAALARVPALKEPALLTLCEFIEDCEHPAIATEILALLAEEGPALPNPSRFVRYVYNRTVLESATVRAAAVAALARFALKSPQLRHQVITLLRRCAYDGEDDVRDRAIFYINALTPTVNEEGEESKDEDKEDDKEEGEDEGKDDEKEVVVKEEDKDKEHKIEESIAALPDLITPSLNVSLDSLVATLEQYVAGPCDAAFSLASVPETAATSPSSATVPVSIAAAVEAEEERKEAESIGVPDISASSSATSAATASISEGAGATSGSSGSVAALAAAAAKAARNPVMSELGGLWHVSRPLALTEKDTEYVVSCTKYTFASHVVLEFTVTNTLPDQRLENVTVALTPVDAAAEEYAVEDAVPAATAPCGTPVTAYVILSAPEGAGIDLYKAKFAATLRFTVREVDEATGEVAEDDVGDEDEYPLDDVEVVPGDFVQPVAAPGFAEEWEALTQEAQRMERYSLASIKSLQDAVAEVVAFLGMAPLGGSEVVQAPGKKHTMTLAGKFFGGVPVFARIRMMLDPSGAGVMIEVAVRSANTEVAALLASSVC